MIHTNRIVTVGEQESIIDRPIVLYRGDREVEADVEEFERNLNTEVGQFKIDTNAAMTTHKNEVSEELKQIENSVGMLLSPNGSRYRLIVSDDGILSVERI